MIQSESMRDIKGLSSLAQGLQEDVEVILVDLKDASVKRTVSSPGVAPFFGIQEGKTKLTGEVPSGIRQEHRKDRGGSLTFSWYPQNPMRPSHQRQHTSQPSHPNMPQRTAGFSAYSSTQSKPSPAFCPSTRRPTTTPTSTAPRDAQRVRDQVPESGPLPDAPAWT